MASPVSLGRLRQPADSVTIATPMNSGMVLVSRLSPLITT